ncbi:hypothetical protein OH492_11635 [Vibrio chagasii]|nr:hypothetical protein [Vibrio chagasii]
MIAFVSESSNPDWQLDSLEEEKRIMTLAIFLSVLICHQSYLVFLLRLHCCACSMALMLHMDFFSADILAQSLINGVDSFTLLAIPFF